MILYLLRHAEAGAYTEHGDSKRTLTEVGKKQALHVGKFCKKYGITPELVLTSPLCRAVETTRALFQGRERDFWENSTATGTCSAAPELIPHFLELAWIASGMSPETAIEELQAYRTLESVMLVGHEPDLSHFIAILLGMTHAENVHIPKASLTAIELHTIAPGAGVLQFLIPVELVHGK